MREERPPMELNKVNRGWAGYTGIQSFVRIM